MSNKLSHGKDCESPELEDCSVCIHFIRKGARIFCGYCPPRVAMHQVIKSQGIYPGKRCILCVHYHKDLKSDTCNDCIVTMELVNFKMRDDLNEILYRMMEAEVNEGKVL